MIGRRRAPREERRRAAIEINLLVEHEDPGPLDRRRRGCALPFLGGAMLLTSLELIRTVLS